MDKNRKSARICALIILTNFFLPATLLANQPISQSANQPINDTPNLNLSTKFLSNLSSKLRHGHPVLQLGGYWGTQGKNQHINIEGLIAKCQLALPMTTTNFTDLPLFHKYTILY